MSQYKPSQITVDNNGVIQIQTYEQAQNAPISEQELDELTNTAVFSDDDAITKATSQHPSTPHQEVQLHKQPIINQTALTIIVIGFIVVAVILLTKIRFKRKKKTDSLLIIRPEARIEHTKEREIRRKARAKRLFKILK